MADDFVRLRFIGRSVKPVHLGLQQSPPQRSQPLLLIADKVSAEIVGIKPNVISVAHAQRGNVGITQAVGIHLAKAKKGAGSRIVAAFVVVVPRGGGESSHAVTQDYLRDALQWKGMECPPGCA